MKFGVREICDVVFKAKAPMQVGNKIFYKDEPVMYFDTLKTSTLEGAATTVYAQGGRGNSRLMSWDGERTVTFTMEDALISPEGLAILTGAGLMDATTTKPIYVHTTEKIAVVMASTATEADADKAKVTIDTQGKLSCTIPLSSVPASADVTGAGIYVMLLDGNDNLMAEPFSSLTDSNGAGAVTFSSSGNTVTVASSTPIPVLKGLDNLNGCKVLVDYYVKQTGSAMQINITPDKFGGAFYIEASTLFREYPSQRDLPAEFIIPNGRVQSNFTFSMAGSGDPSTFTFTVDAFPDYTRFDPTEKVLAAIQVIGGSDLGKSVTNNRDSTNSAYKVVNNVVTPITQTTSLDD